MTIRLPHFLPCPPLSAPSLPTTNYTVPINRPADSSTDKAILQSESTTNPGSNCLCFGLFSASTTNEARRVATSSTRVPASKPQSASTRPHNALRHFKCNHAASPSTSYIHIDPPTTSTFLDPRPLPGPDPSRGRLLDYFVHLPHHRRVRLVPSIPPTHSCRGPQAQPRITMGCLPRRNHSTGRPNSRWSCHNNH
jgi:hypothetical protein